MERIRTERVGIMGGTFDPPHFGHFIIAQVCLEQLDLDKVLFIPTGKIVYKKASGEADGTDRYNMLKSVIDSNPDFELSDVEIKQSETTYTANTLTRLKNGEYKNSEIYFLMGADSLDYMDKWYKPEVIFSLCTVAVVERPGISSSGLDEKIETLTKTYGARIERVLMPLVDISSTALRQRVKRGRSIRYLTHDSIINYIKQHNLYGGEPYGGSNERDEH